MLSRIIIHPDAQIRESAIKVQIANLRLTVPHPDVLLLEDDTKLGIQQAKEIIQFLSFKPYQAQGRVVGVVSAQALSYDAQNALLKTIEEPTDYNLIVLGTNSENALLQTVRSRCHIEVLPMNESKEGIDTTEVEKLIGLDLPKRFAVIEKCKDKDQLFHKILVYFHQQFPKHPEFLPFMQTLIEAEKWKKQSGNIRAILEYLMLKLPS